MAGPKTSIELTRPDFFVFRTALLPFDTFLQWSEGLEAPHCVDDPVRLEQALLSDRRRSRERLHAIAIRPEVREGLFLASPDVAAALERGLENPEGKKAKRLERTLVRYFSRMSGRATPFGLFAGYSVGRPGPVTRLEVEAMSTYRRHTRLDMDYLSALVEGLARHPDLQSGITYRPNASLYRTSGPLRYFESRLKENARSYHLVAVEATDYLLETLRRADGGATVMALAEALVDDEVTLEDATGYVRELVATQLLVPDLAPKATGPEPMDDLLSQLSAYPAARSVCNRLEEVRQLLKAMDEEPPGIDIQRYKAIAARLEDLPAKVELSKLVQVDMVKPAGNATLGGDVLDEIGRTVHLLQGLRPAPPEDEFTLFREAFRTRYENRELPLLEVLDEESGIGFGPSMLRGEASPLLDGLAFPEGRSDDRVRWATFDSFLLNKLDETARAGRLVMNLEPEELERFRTPRPAPLPDAFTITAKLAANSPEALAAGDFTIMFSSLSGPSGASLLGRFCHGDERLLDHVRAYLDAEESLQPDAVFAEIVHLPEGRVGNVVLRPPLRAYEIPFLGRAAVPQDRQIPLSDLMVSVQGKTIVLRSKKLGRTVIPRLTNAHNFRRGLGIYRFLCTLQYQHTGGGLAWNWGTLEAARHLPRVVVGRVVLALARWRVQRKELQAAIDAKDAVRYKLAQQWRRDRGLPRHVVLTEGDNTLPFDLDNELSLETFLELFRKRGEFRLQELYPEPDQLCATGPEGRFVHELVIPIVREREAVAASPRGDILVDTPVRRSFPPGSEWLYARLYTGYAGADRLLGEVISPLVHEAMSSGGADGWFFMRYSDPDWHLRLRFHGNPARLRDAVLPRLQALCAPLVESGLLWKIELGTYEREIERYGRGEAMLLAERLFQFDSEAVLAALEDASGDADVRWRVALRGVDQMLDDFGLDPELKLALISESRRASLAEIDAPAAFDHQLGDRFRRERRSLESLLDRANDSSSAFAGGLSALHTRSQKLRPIVVALQEISSAGRLSPPLQSLVSSYVHMHTNRMLRSSGRAQELVIYDFLVRLYESQKARLFRRDRPKVAGT